MKNKLLFLGPPGAGKGTQANLYCKKYGLDHLSTGDLLRDEVSSGSVLGIKAAEIMNKGELVSDDLVLSIVEGRLLNTKKGWLLDGFPRNVNQASSLEKLLEKINQPLEAVILIKTADDYLIKRLLERGRQDDNEQVIINRLKIYREKTSPLIDLYTKQGILEGINGNADIDVVFSCIEKALG
ncbi:adenylate kinase [Prochlorococcus marinus]|uniref:Adenylate kinase n=1 Tax=Prochlorococcus marinus XMU1408 TaxID=2213228 RepID=A0A318QWC8_PROMR|nr:adenylate kinase [Prochlorococcus marinus]MBW3042759.1 adenylate kinase [Prochlorococcus marinus str. XMU1408]PYE00589.1 adenylate kinase [Prochlorococcus marinus XMU1408]